MSLQFLFKNPHTALTSKILDRYNCRFSSADIMNLAEQGWDTAQYWLAQGLAEGRYGINIDRMELMRRVNTVNKEQENHYRKKLSPKELVLVLLRFVATDKK